MKTTPLSAKRTRLEECDAEIWVAGRLGTNVLARRLYWLFLENKDQFVDLACMGVDSVNQAVKGVAAGRTMLRPADLDLIVVPWFSEYVERGQKQTRIMLRVWATAVVLEGTDVSADSDTD